VVQTPDPTLPKLDYPTDGFIEAEMESPSGNSYSNIPEDAEELLSGCEAYDHGFFNKPLPLVLDAADSPVLGLTQLTSEITSGTSSPSPPTSQLTPDMIWEAENLLVACDQYICHFWTGFHSISLEPGESTSGV
jgi:hypothetical protein